jgi:hypothetical protein
MFPGLPTFGKHGLETMFPCLPTLRKHGLETMFPGLPTFGKHRYRKQCFLVYQPFEIKKLFYLDSILSFIIDTVDSQKPSKKKKKKRGRSRTNRR